MKANPYEKDPAVWLRRLDRVDAAIDVGVGGGTHRMYQAWPHAQHILIEPAQELFEERIKALPIYRPENTYWAACGAYATHLNFPMRTDKPQHSSLLRRTKLTQHQDAQEKVVNVPQVTLNQVWTWQELSRKNCVYIKIDVEGYELEVLKGGGIAIAGAKYVEIETSVAKRFQDSYTFSDIIAKMREYGHELFAIPTVQWSSNQQGTRFADLLFKRVGDGKSL